MQARRPALRRTRPLRRALATLVSTYSGVILAAMSRECWSTTVSWPPPWPAWRCWPRRWIRSWPPWCCSWTVSGPRCPGALRGHHALQHVEGRLVCLVGETRGQRALQRCDAASVRGHLSVRGGQGRRRGKRRNCRRQRAAVQV